MTRSRGLAMGVGRQAWIAPALVAVLVAVAGGRAVAQEGPGQADPSPAASDGIGIRLEIEETLDDKPYKHMVSTHYIRKKLRDLGFRAWSTVKRPKDDEEWKALAEKERAAGREPPPLLEDLKPEPSLVIKGTCKVRFDRSSDFYGADLASIYKAEIALEILDPAGKVLATLRSEDEWGRADKKEARDQILSRIGLFGAAEVLGSEPVRARLTETLQKEAQAFVDKINGQRKKSDG